MPNNIPETKTCEGGPTVATESTVLKPLDFRVHYEQIDINVCLFYINSIAYFFLTQKFVPLSTETTSATVHIQIDPTADSTGSGE